MRLAGKIRVLEGFSPDQEKLEASVQELLEEKEQALEVLRRLGFDVSET